MKKYHLPTLLRTNYKQADADGVMVLVSRQLLHEGADEIDRYAVWVDDLQSEMFVNCVYCGHRYGPGETTPVSMADALKAHIAKCPQHPMSRLLKALTEVRDAKMPGQSRVIAIRALREFGGE